MLLSSAKTCPDWLEPNDGEHGYYQVNYKNGLLDKVLAGHAEHVSLPEKVGVLGNVESLVKSGDLSPGVALALVPEYSQDPNREIVSATARIAEILKSGMVPDDLRPKGAAFIRQAFGKRAEELGWIGKPEDSEDTRLLRQQLLPFVAGIGEDRELIQEADRFARKWLTDRNAIPPDMITPVLHVAAEFGNQEL